MHVLNQTKQCVGMGNFAFVGLRFQFSGLFASIHWHKG